MGGYGKNVQGADDMDNLWHQPAAGVPNEQPPLTTWIICRTTPHSMIYSASIIYFTPSLPRLTHPPRLLSYSIQILFF